MKTGALKAYMIVVGLMLILFGTWIAKRAFVGKHMDQLDAVNKQIDDSHSMGQAPPTPAPVAGGETPPAAVAPAAPSAAPAAAPAAAPESAAPPAAQATPTPTPTPTPTSTMGAPEKGGLGDTVKKIREKEGRHNKQLEDSFETPPQ